MQLRPKLTCLPGQDFVEGFENLGEMGSTCRPADHTQVFMTRGVTNKWKQPFGSSNLYSCARTPASIMKHQLVPIIRQLRQAGMVVLATVCDMGTPNQALYKVLGVTEDTSHSLEGKQLRLFDNNLRLGVFHPRVAFTTPCHIKAERGCCREARGRIRSVRCAAATGRCATYSNASATYYISMTFWWMASFFHGITSDSFISSTSFVPLGACPKLVVSFDEMQPYEYDFFPLYWSWDHSSVKNA